MSKIPQGEWNAIAARYAKGESISRIAQSYGCTPPAIHYILKRIRHRTAQRTEQPPLNGPPGSPATRSRRSANTSANRPPAPKFPSSPNPRRDEPISSRWVTDASKDAPRQPIDLGLGLDR